MRTKGTMNYPGRVAVKGQMMGPDYIGRYWIAVSSEYDEQNDFTKVHFALAAVDE